MTGVNLGIEIGERKNVSHTKIRFLKQVRIDTDLG